MLCLTYTLELFGPLALKVLTSMSRLYAPGVKNSYNLRVSSDKSHHISNSMSSSGDMGICLDITSWQGFIAPKTSSRFFFHCSALPSKLCPIAVWRRILCLCDIETPNLFSRVKSWVFAPLSRRITEMQLARADILWFRVLEVADVARAIALLAFISFSSDLCTPQAPTTLACQKGHITFTSCVTKRFEYAASSLGEVPLRIEFVPWL